MDNEIVLGYPEFWSTVHKELRPFFDAAERAESAINEIFRESVSEPLHKICRHLAKMTANSFSALLLLGMNGFGPDAMKIARSMFETAVTIGYLRKHPEELEDYFNFHWVISKRRLEHLAKYDPERLKEISPEAIRRTETEYERVAEQFKNRDGKVRNRWCKRSLAAMAADVNLAQHYGTVYPLASNMHHGDIGGVFTQIDPEPGVLDVDVAPSMEWVAEALVAGHAALVMACSEYVDMALPEKREITAEMASAFHSAWSK